MRTCSRNRRSLEYLLSSCCSSSFSDLRISRCFSVFANFVKSWAFSAERWLVSSALNFPCAVSCSKLAVTKVICNLRCPFYFSRFWIELVCLLFSLIRSSRSFASLSRWATVTCSSEPRRSFSFASSSLSFVIWSRCWEAVNSSCWSRAWWTETALFRAACDCSSSCFSLELA